MKLCNHCSKVKSTRRYRLRINLDPISEGESIPLPGRVKELRLCHECTIKLVNRIDLFWEVST